MSEENSADSVDSQSIPGLIAASSLPLTEMTETLSSELLTNGWNPVEHISLSFEVLPATTKATESPSPEQPAKFIDIFANPKANTTAPVTFNKNGNEYGAALLETGVVLEPGLPIEIQHNPTQPAANPPWWPPLHQSYSFISNREVASAKSLETEFYQELWNAMAEEADMPELVADNTVHAELNSPDKSLELTGQSDEKIFHLAKLCERLLQRTTDLTKKVNTLELELNRNDELCRKAKAQSEGLATQNKHMSNIIKTHREVALDQQRLIDSMLDRIAQLESDLKRTRLPDLAVTTQATIPLMQNRRKTRAQRRADYPGRTD